MSNLNFEPRVIADNEYAVNQALQRGDYLQAFLLIHVLIESLLRSFLDKRNEHTRFVDLITVYENFLKEYPQPSPTFVKELTEFNRRRNRIIHELWQKGYTDTNKKAEPAAGAAVLMYGLLIDYLSTFDDTLEGKGFKLNA